jgi:hypothetical protein
VGSAVYHLERRVSIIPFGRGFFGSPFSGSFAQTVTIPNVRISAAEMFVTNLHGNSPTTYRNYTSTQESGLRTLSGGQITMQLEGPLAIEDDAAAPLIVEGAHAIQEILAMVREAPTGSPVVVQLRLDDVEVCQLTIPAGAHVSNTVDGFGLAPLTDGSTLKLDVVSVGLDVQDSPGQDLTLTIRL